MKRTFIIILILVSFIVLIALFTKKDSMEDMVSPGSLISELTLLNLDGGSWNISQEMGSVVILNFWASWCISCKEEMPSMNDFYKSIKNMPEIKLITILYRDDPQTALSYMKSEGYDFPVKLDPSLKAARLLGVTGVPETYIIDKEGRLVERVIGPFDWNDKDFRAYIMTLK